MIEEVGSYRGRVLAERYQLQELIGSGSMGAVYRAWDRQREQACAVKLLHGHAARQDAAMLRFHDEMRLVVRLCHPHIVDMYDQGETGDGAMFLVMELLKGQDLQTLLQAEPTLTLARTQELVRQVGSALHTVHLSGIVHRDIKPRNIFLVKGVSRDGTSSTHVKVIDFGQAKILNAQSLWRRSDGLIIGTPEYLPPEAWRGDSRNIDSRADQWALAVVTYRMLTGRLPFDSGLNTIALAHEIQERMPPAASSLAEGIPEHVDAALMRALAKDKEQRFRSINDFVRALHGRTLASAAVERNDQRAAELRLQIRETQVKQPGQTAQPKDTLRRSIIISTRQLPTKPETISRADIKEDSSTWVRMLPLLSTAVKRPFTLPQVTRISKRSILSWWPGAATLVVTCGLLCAALGARLLDTHEAAVHDLSLQVGEAAYPDSPSVAAKNQPPAAASSAAASKAMSEFSLSMPFYQSPHPQRLQVWDTETNDWVGWIEDVGCQNSRNQPVRTVAPRKHRQPIP